MTTCKSCLAFLASFRRCLILLSRTVRMTSSNLKIIVMHKKSEPSSRRGRGKNTLQTSSPTVQRLTKRQQMVQRFVQRVHSFCIRRSFPASELFSNRIFRSLRSFLFSGSSMLRPERFDLIRIRTEMFFDSLFRQQTTLRIDNFQKLPFDN